MPKFDIKVTLSERSSVPSVLDAVIGALKKEGVTETEIKEFLKQATWSDYEHFREHLFAVCRNWVDIDL